MMASLFAFVEQLPDLEIHWNEPLARHTTFRIGGPVACLVRPHSVEALGRVLGAVREAGVSCLLLGGGSNILAPDEALPVVAVQLTLCCNALERRGETPEGQEAVYAGAGVRTARLLRFCVASGLGGLEGLAGIPGSVGGAVIMNAGTRDGCIADATAWVDVLDQDGRRRSIPRRELDAGYRSMGLAAGCVVLGAQLELTPQPLDVLKTRLREIVQARKRTQPLGWPSAGCIYKNTGEAPAGLLIDRAGFKGRRVGDAEVSPKHANWIVNRGAARAADVLALMGQIEERVAEEFGIRLEREIRVFHRRGAEDAEFIGLRKTYTQEFGNIF